VPRLLFSQFFQFWMQVTIQDIESESGFSFFVWKTNPEVLSPINSLSSFATAG
jgi:hypothetical protein